MTVILLRTLHLSGKRMISSKKRGDRVPRGTGEKRMKGLQQAQIGINGKFFCVIYLGSAIRYRWTEIKADNFIYIWAVHCDKGKWCHLSQKSDKGMNSTAKTQILYPSKEITLSTSTIWLKILWNVMTQDMVCWDYKTLSFLSIFSFGASFLSRTGSLICNC